VLHNNYVHCVLLCLLYDNIYDRVMADLLAGWLVACWSDNITQFLADGNSPSRVKSSMVFYRPREMRPLPMALAAEAGRSTRWWHLITGPNWWWWWWCWYLAMSKWMGWVAARAVPRASHVDKKWARVTTTLRINDV